MLEFKDIHGLDLDIVNTGNSLTTGGIPIIEATAPPWGYPPPDPDMAPHLPPEWMVWGAYGAVVVGLVILLWKDRD